MGILAAACQPTPRMATATAQAGMPPTPSSEPVILPAPAETAVFPPSAPLATGPNPSITVWINETSPEHKQILNQMAAEFSQLNQIDVELLLVSPALLPKLMETAVLSPTFPMPDLVLHPIEYTMGWAERGILDVTAANDIINELGRDTFNPEALTPVTQNGQTAAIPSDGYPQLLIYRTDWVENFNLTPPDNFEAMLTMAQTISNTEALISGFVIPTESNLITTHQAFEQLAAANGCQLIDEKGEVQILQPACQEALNFYFNIVHNYSPTGVQTDTSARTAYLDGRTGLIISSPSILLRLAGLTADTPNCAECAAAPDFLVQNSGFVTRITGAQAANLSEMTYLGITSAAERETAVAFARYWFNEGYADWLAVESERKIPLRWGTANAPDQFINAWGTQPLAADTPSLTDIYGAETVTQLRDSISVANRWGFTQGQGGIVTELYEELTFSVVLQEMLSGYFNPDQTLVEMYARIVDLIPNYSYDGDTTTE